MIFRNICISIALSNIALCSVPPHTPKGLLYESLSKNGLVRRSVLENGDYCHVREYFGEEHFGMRIAYFIPERDADEKEIKSIISKLAKQFCGKKEAPLILEAVRKFKAPTTGNVDHWVIDLNNSNYSEFFVIIDLIGESIAIQVKYYQ